jgi:hypothetical protein
VTAIRYILYVPARPPTPGKVIVHNNVHPENFHPRYEPGLRGFRVWLSEPGPDLVRCDCGWAPKAGDHYRLDGAEELGL